MTKRICLPVQEMGWKTDQTGATYLEPRTRNICGEFGDHATPVDVMVSVEEIAGKQCNAARDPQKFACSRFAIDYTPLMRPVIARLQEGATAQERSDAAVELTRFAERIDASDPIRATILEALKTSLGDSDKSVQKAASDGLLKLASARPVAAPKG